jgi:hypothetical protein
MTVKTEFETVFRRLKTILNKQRKGLKVGTDAAGSYALITGADNKYRKPIWFGAVRPGKAYVSYHLMGVYMYPDLARRMSPELKKRMQGKSCFNFKRVDPVLFAELDRLTGEARKRFEKERLV